MVRYYEFVNLYEDDMTTKDPRILRAIALHKEGKRNFEIAKELGISDVTISKWLAKHIEDYKKRVVYADNVKQEAIKLHHGGKNFKEISAILGCEQSTVFKWISADPGYDKQERSLDLTSLLTDQDHDQMVEMLRSGKTIKDIAKHFLCGRYYVGNIIRARIPKEEYERLVGVKIGGPRIVKGITPADIDNIAIQYRNGVSTAAIGRQYNVVPSTITHHMKKHREDFAELYAERQANIALRHNQTQATTDIHRSGTIGNQKSKGFGSKHTHGVDWQKLN
jgi:transposase-like protein